MTTLLFVAIVIGVYALGLDFGYRKAVYKFNPPPVRHDDD